MQIVDALKICDLVDAPIVVPRLSVLLNEQWGQVHGRSSFEIEASVRRWCRKGETPWGVVAIAGSEPAGIAVLHMELPKTRRTALPWLSTVFVPPRYRNRGVGSALVRAVEKRAASLGYTMLYLYTLDRAPLYSRLGWVAFDTDVDRGNIIVLMRKHLA